MAKVLIGFMGSGKSTVARLLDDNFVDMDTIITNKIDMPIADFFEKKGEIAFRELESHVLEDLLETDQVISTGGGVVVSEKNRQLLAANDQTIYLKADFDTLYDRISADCQNIRPLFINNSKKDFRAIFEARQAWYEEIASQIIDVTGKSPQEIIGEIE